MQKVLVGHETESLLLASIFCSELQLVPFQMSVLPLPSVSMQKVDETHDTEVRSFVPSIPAPEDQVGAEFATVIENVFVEVCAGELESDTSTVKVEIPEALGVPEIEPEDDAKLSPAGSDAAGMDHV